MRGLLRLVSCTWWRCGFSTAVLSCLTLFFISSDWQDWHFTNFHWSVIRWSSCPLWFCMPSMKTLLPLSGSRMTMSLLILNVLMDHCPSCISAFSVFMLCIWIYFSGYPAYPHYLRWLASSVFFLEWTYIVCRPILFVVLFVWLVKAIIVQSFVHTRSFTLVWFVLGKICNKGNFLWDDYFAVE